MEQRQGDKISTPTLVFAISSTTVATLPVFLTGALGVEISKSLALKPSQLGLLIGAFFASATLSSVTSGKISESHGGTFIIRLGVVSTAIWTLAIFVFAHSFLQFLVFLIFAGITNGAIQPAVNVYVANAIPRSRQGFAFGVKQAAIPVSTLLSGLAVPLVALTLGWHYAYLGTALLGILLAITLPKNANAARYVETVAAPKKTYKILPLVVLAAAMALGAGAANALGAFLVEDAVRVGWSPADAGLLVVLGSLAGMISRVINGHLADKRGGRHFVVTAQMIFLGSLGYAMLAFHISYLILPATVITYGLGWGWNGLFNYAVIKTHPQSAGRATGTTQSGAYIGSVFGPILFGFVAQHYSFNLAWYLAAASAVVSAGTMVLGRHLIVLRDAS
ncbi:MFS transporter [Ferrimicrobium acidiphilum]|uniref:MFS transporter n=1 Tax=Ferrimicrobium acidiphilum TaxID=121039 RepID=UPI0023F21E54|nr:MFS transporter [Ferrimicrobium acidiphilum]